MTSESLLADFQPPCVVGKLKEKGKKLLFEQQIQVIVFLLSPTCPQRVNHQRNAAPLGRNFHSNSKLPAKLSFSTFIFVRYVTMATGGFKSNAATDFLEEWKAKREKMRAKMLGDIAASTGAPLAATTSSSGGGGLERGLSSGNCFPSSHSVPRSSSASALKRPEEETPQLHHHHSTSTAAAAAPTPGSNPKKGPPPSSPQSERAPESSSPPPPASPTPPPQRPAVCKDSDSPSQSPSPGKAKEKNSSGPSARKGKGQIEKRKLREKRRSTGVVSIPSSEVSPPAAHLRPLWFVVVGFVVLLFYMVISKRCHGIVVCLRVV